MCHVQQPGVSSNTVSLFGRLCPSPLLLQVKSLKEDLQKGKLFHIYSIIRPISILNIIVIMNYLGFLVSQKVNNSTSLVSTTLDDAIKLHHSSSSLLLTKQHHAGHNTAHYHILALIDIVIGN